MSTLRKFDDTPWRIEISRLQNFARGFYQLAQLRIEDIEAAKLVVPLNMLLDMQSVGATANLACKSPDSYKYIDQRVERIRKEFLSPGSVYERE